MKKIILLVFVFDGPPLRCFGPMSTVSISDIFVKINDDHICEKNTSFGHLSNYGNQSLEFFL